MFRGTGASATLLAAVGGGGQGGLVSLSDGGAGGGWSDVPGRLLHGQPGTGPGAGGGATPTAGGQPWSGQAVHRGTAGEGPVVRPGDYGTGGYVWEHYYTEDRNGTTYYIHMTTPAGGHGYYGGASASFTENTVAGGAGGGSGYLAPGIVPQRPTQETVDAAWTRAGRVAVEWRNPVTVTPVLELDGRVVDPAALPSRTFDVVVCDLPAGAELTVTGRPGDLPTERATVGRDGTVRVRYVLPREADDVTLDLALRLDGQVIGTAQVDVVPPARSSSAGGVSTRR